MNACSTVSTTKYSNLASFEQTTPEASFSTLSNASTALELQPQTPTRPHLLCLPAELRIGIYETILLDATPDLSILQSCRMVAMEAQPTLYQRHLTFTSQAKLFEWIERSRSSNLKRVRSLALRLTDIDLSPLFDQDSSKRQTRTSAWTLYQSEVEKFDNALMALPNIAELTVTPPKTGHSQLLQGMYLSFLELVPRRYPNLKQLEVDDTKAVLDKVPLLKDLSSVSFSVADTVEQSGPKQVHDPVTSLSKPKSNGIAKAPLSSASKAHSPFQR